MDTKLQVRIGLAIRRAANRVSICVENAWIECLYRPATVRAVCFVLLSSILFFSVAFDLAAIDPTGAILSLMLFFFIAWLGITVAADLDNTPEIKADRLMSRLTQSHRQIMAVAFASGTLSRLGEKSPLNILPSDIISLIIQKAYRADEVCPLIQLLSHHSKSGSL
jgi:cytochrome c oxidase assembly factor CtaG